MARSYTIPVDITLWKSVLQALGIGNLLAKPLGVGENKMVYK